MSEAPESAENPLVENRQLRARLAELTAEAARNASLLEKTHARELELLHAESLPELLELLIERLRDSYQLDRVSLLLADPQHDTRHLAGDGVAPEILANVRYVDGFDAVALSLGGLARPWLGKRLPADAVRAIRPLAAGGSYALLPLVRAERRLGLLALESRDSGRFHAGLATDFLGHLGAVAAVCLENAVNRARLLRTGVTDYLTGFHNRRYLNARLREELARAQRTGGTVGLLMIDVDYFKQINDRHGHLAGDAVLKEVARRIAAQIRSSDTAARFGGDEFAILMGGARRENLVGLATRLEAALKPAITVTTDVSQVITLSIGGGVAEVAPDERDLPGLAERLIADADAALYQAKEAGRNRSVVAERVVR